ncbi:MAG: AMP-binding protein [Acidimicrobiales bacterium]
MATVDELIRARRADDSPGLYFEDQIFTHAELVAAAAQRAAYLSSRLGPGRPSHVGVLLDNVPEFPMWLGAAAVSGCAVVGINPTRRGDELARDITHTRCQLIVTETAYLPLLAGLDLGGAEEAVLVIDSEDYDDELASFSGADLGPPVANESSLYLLLFTSGTTGAPKACLCSQGRLARIGTALANMYSLGPFDVCYQSMPLFHSNALMAGWAPALVAGAAGALRRRFSASGFLPDVRRFGATYFNYVGRPLSYILATPEQPDDADNPLVRVFGNEGSELDIARFAERFGCQVTDSYGSTEGGVSVGRLPGMPTGALGRGSDTTVVLDPETARECATAVFSPEGILLNPNEAIGELVDRGGAVNFEGYWDNDEAGATRVRGGMYWSGDLAYRDADGWIYFAGRDFDWLRVDGENFAAAPLERILSRWDPVVLAAVYAVPDPEVGDLVMASLQLEPGAGFDPDAFSSFLAGQADLGAKWAPHFVRACAQIPVTPTNKVLKRQLRAEAWRVDDPVWWRPNPKASYRCLAADDIVGLEDRFKAHDRSHLLGI